MTKRKRTNNDLHSGKIGQNLCIKLPVSFQAKFFRIKLFVGNLLKCTVNFSIFNTLNTQLKITLAKIKIKNESIEELGLIRKKIIDGFDLKDIEKGAQLAKSEAAIQVYKELDDCRTIRLSRFS
jgi:hypothetical protein